MNVKPDEFQDLLLTLNTVKIQCSRLNKFQLACYKWNLQHHDNLKNMIALLNTMSEELELKLGSTLPRIQLSEDQSLMNEVVENFGKQSQQSHDLQKGTDFNSLIMANMKDLHSIEDAILDMDDSQFLELKDESVAVLVPLMILWLGDTTNKKMFALLFLIESFKNFGGGYRLLPKKVIVNAVETLENVIPPPQFSEDLPELRRFLSKLL